ncbi:hypothetical protein SDC9_64759 [bioreactor metagenome]|uniref:Uncharacterized protein n=1 Tax=bioreactor metagenome TaxID=1076179 RepID=A0A644XQ58_9ZZZZ
MQFIFSASSSAARLSWQNALDPQLCVLGFHQVCYYRWILYGYYNTFFQQLQGFYVFFLNFQTNYTFSIFDMFFSAVLRCMHRKKVRAAGIEPASVFAGGFSLMHRKIPCKYVSIRCVILLADRRCVGGSHRLSWGSGSYFLAARFGRGCQFSRSAASQPDLQFP